MALKKKASAAAQSVRISGSRSDNKSIVLFSDGTGNSSGKLFKTNVWRTYEAVDLGPSPPDQRDQIAYYDNGVGTASFRPLRLLQGAFGWGLKRNVLEIYRYACRNYEPGKGQKVGVETDDLGDHFYGFGFSRGAFTMRLAIDLIAAVGIVTAENESELTHKTKQAFRHYCSSSETLGWKALPTQFLRFLGRPLAWLLDKLHGIPPYDRANNYHPAIKFIGVWDTVAAYGGPIVEITRAIDMFVYPLSMPSYHLNPRVQRARHALALDDERDSFQPLIWDEVHEQTLIDDKSVKQDRLEQVWFTGMHADVGGGYPDESLSYVSLLWMIEEAGEVGLRVLDVIIERYIALANSFGPMHDSRGGLASYYRYQPRKIAALMDEPDIGTFRKTLSLRDPSIRHGHARTRGLLTDVKVHESVIARVANGTDSYAPIVLPDRFSIVPPGLLSEAQPQNVSGSPPGCRRASLNVMKHAVLERTHRDRLANAETVALLGRRIERAWNLVWARRLVYFATVAATVALLLLPLWGDDWSPFATNDGKTAVYENLLPRDDRNWLGNVIRLPTAFLPEFLHGWVEAVARSPYWLLGLAALIVFLNWIAKLLERALRGRAGDHWMKALGEEEEEQEAPRLAPFSRFRRWIYARIEALRISVVYQWSVAAIKWYFLPFLIGILILALIFWAVLAVATQVRLPTLEAGEGLCRETRTTEPLERHQIEFETNRLCNPVARRVSAEQRYTITFDVGDTWSDGRHRADPTGLGAFGTGWAGPFGVPLRRVVNAGYLQPVVEIRDGNMVQIHALEVEPVPDSSTRFRAVFDAPVSGELFLFANDSILPFASDWTGLGLDHDYFYAGAIGRNGGNACVTIEVDGASAPLPEPSQDSVCDKIARRDAATRPGEAVTAAAPGPPKAPDPARAVAPAGPTTTRPRQGAAAVR